MSRDGLSAGCPIGAPQIGWRRRRRRLAVRRIARLLSAWLAIDAHAQSREPNCAGELNLFVENDAFVGTDSGYSSGVKASWSSANLTSFTDDPCVPSGLRAVNRLLQWTAPAPAEARNMMFGIGQQIYTPLSRRRTDVVLTDRPYAGWLFLAFGYNARTSGRMDTVELNIGVIGPGALARQTQDRVHDVLNYPHFQGWANQLHGELGVQWVAERKLRTTLLGDSRAPRADAIGHFGISLGNVASYANFGFELRYGHGLRNDFGNATLRPGAGHRAPAFDGAADSNPGVYGFVASNAQAVARNIFLDGNTFADSHRVDKKRLVADLTLGLAWQGRHWSLRGSHSWETREFTTQQRTQRWGALQISYSY